jgi:farnesyl diphosphate synthase
MNNQSHFHVALTACAQDVQNRLECILNSVGGPLRLIDAMRHGVLGGGKRLRPFLLMETVRCLGGDISPHVLNAAVALECVHSYSLVHDDLPCMDDDDLRRGQPTVHVAFDEATAILAGDALLTLAFEILGEAAVPPRLIFLLARAAGASGMVGGQMLDLAAEGRFDGGTPLRLSAGDILNFQQMKTGAMLAVAVEMGACLGQADAVQLTAFQAYGQALGAAFQIADDLLDIEGDAAQLGKATGKDTARGKGTLVSLWGIDKARAHLAACARDAQAALEMFQDKADFLSAAVQFVLGRKI